MSNFPYISINKFYGVDRSNNKLASEIPGQLLLNQNYLYMNNGGLEERGGGAKLTNAPTANLPIYGLGVYQNNISENFLIASQLDVAGMTNDLYYYDSGWNALGILQMGLTNRVRFEQAGYDVNRALYVVNGADGVFKITGNVPTASAVASSPVSPIIKLHKNRLFATDGKDTLYFTDALAFDTWTTGTNNIQIAPGIDGYIKALEVWGDALFIFKEFGVYVLPNAGEADPTSSWKVLRADAVTGTQSPDTVLRTRVGIFYLATDNSIRIISPSISFSSAEFTLEGSGSPSVSEYIQDDINLYLSDSAKSSAMAMYYKDKYIIWFQSVNGSVIDKCYFADTTKFLKPFASEINQPFWGEFTGVMFDVATVFNSNGKEILYGAKPTIGEVHSFLDSSLHSDNGVAIQSKAVMSWFAPGGAGLLKKFNYCYVSGDTENWYLNLIFKGYRLGNRLPDIGSGLTDQFTSGFSTSVADVAIADVDVVASLGQATAKYRLGLKGNYFRVEFYNYNINQFTRINNLVLYYRPVRSK